MEEKTSKEKKIPMEPTISQRSNKGALSPDCRLGERESERRGEVMGQT